MNTLTALAALSLTCSSHALSLDEIKAWKIQGEHQSGLCAHYAFHLNYKLSLAGVDSTMLAYDWSRKSKSGLPRRSQAKAGHALVIFSLNDRYYGMDNENDKPKQLKGNTDLERVKSFDRRAYQTRAINFGSPKEYQELADSITQRQ